jgi:hypothetical protein
MSVEDVDLKSRDQLAQATDRFEIADVVLGSSTKRPDIHWRFGDLVGQVPQFIEDCNNVPIGVTRSVNELD